MKITNKTFGKISLNVVSEIIAPILPLFIVSLFSPSITFLYSGSVSFAAIALFLWLGKYFKQSINIKPNIRADFNIRNGY